MVRALGFARTTGNRLDIVKTLVQLGQLHVVRFDLPAAQGAFCEAAAVGREIHAESLLVDVIAGLADLALAVGRRSEAIELYRAVQGHAAASQEAAGRASDRLRDLGAGVAGARLSLDAALALGLG